jgi:uncharacterized membrane protein YdjX (TVP38/TMEM64 family)
MIATLIILILESVFSIPAVKDWFNDIITNSSGIVVYIVIWLIMFLQVTILNVPAYVILSASIVVGIETLSFVYIAVVMSAYMCGCILAYWIGRKFGAKAVKWCAGSEDDYKKWSTALNSKGKWWYLVTVVFPMFPDDILCMVAGAMKFDFKFYVFANFIGRTIGLVTALLTLNLLNMGDSTFPYMIIVWAVALIAEFVIYLVLKKKEKKNELNDNRE